MNATESMGFQEAVKTCFNKYVKFDGRARRSEYWYFYLFTVILYLILGVLAEFGTLFVVINWLISLALFLPSLAVAIRRMHDINKSGWNILWGLIPILGTIYVIYLCCKDSDQVENQYGPSPKYTE